MYLLIHESRHSGWVCMKTTKRNADKILKDEDNCDVYVCETTAKVSEKVWFDRENSSPWVLNTVLTTDPDDHKFTVVIVLDM